MKFLRKIDLYLLENHPIVWRSKLVYLLPIGLLLWLLFFAIGYFTTNQRVMLERYNYSRYTDTYSILLHIILALIILSVWALHFYKKNAVRHYYPLGRFYFTKLYLLIAFGFLPIISLFIPFQEGVRNRERSMVSLDTLREDMKVYNLASVFLGDNAQQYDYELQHRAYPAPFPMTILVKRDQLTQFEGYEGFRYTDPTGKERYYHPDSYPEHTFKLDETDQREYQFLKTLQEKVSPSCNETPISHILEFYHPDTTVKWKNSSLLNYSNVAVRHAYAPEFHPYEWSGYYSSNNITLFQDEQLEYARYYAPTIHRWVEGEKEDSIRYILTSFQEILRKYGIAHKLDPAILAKSVLLAEQNFETNFDAVATSYSVYALNTLHPHAADLKRETYKYIQEGVELSELHTLLHNSEDAYYHETYQESNTALFLVSLIVVFILAMVLLLFDFTPLIEFLIAIPIAGILMILVGFMGFIIDLNCRGYSEYYGFPSETYVSLLITIVAVMLLCTSIISIYSNRFGKRISGILLNIGYFVAPIVPISALNIIIQFSRRWKKVCGYLDLEYPEWFGKNETLLVFVCMMLGLIGLLWYFRFIKAWYAKKS